MLGNIFDALNERYDEQRREQAVHGVKQSVVIVSGRLKGGYAINPLRCETWTIHAKERQ